VKFSVLVVANRTADSPELLDARVAKLTDALVTHVVASETASPPASVAHTSESE
jgi:predicted short-subunit dehydrogenase-like oxidoreductase (DUF2520 family)